MELVQTESDLTALVARVRAAKADLKEAIQISGHAHKGAVEAENALRAARERYHAMRGILLEVASGPEDPSMW